MIRTALLFPVKPRVTHILIAINVIVFLAGFMLPRGNGPNAGPTRLTGSITGADLLHGEWWRLLTCCFVHHGILHILMNMYSLWVVGPLVEQFWGRTRFLVIYLLAGLGGSCAAMAFGQLVTVNGQLKDLAGASGALWGVLASLPVWLMLNQAFLPQRFVSAMMRQLISVFIINAIISFIPGISKEAHFGGGAVGALVAVLLNFHRFGTGMARWVFVPLVALVPVLCVGGLMRQMERDPRKWQDVKAAAERELIQAAAERKRIEAVEEINEEKEMSDFNKHWLPEIQTRYRDNESVLKKLEDWLIDERPAAPPPEEMRSTLKSARENTGEFLNKFHAAPRYQSDFVRKAQATAGDLLKKQESVFLVLERKFDLEKPWTAKDQRDLEAAISRKQNVLKDWRDMVRENE